MPFQILNSFSSNDIAIDLGTANTLLFSRKKGIIFNEPTCVAYRGNSRREAKNLLAIGHEAYAMIGKTHPRIKTVMPLCGGAISDLKMTELFIRELLRRHMRRGVIKPNIIISIPNDLTLVEKNAVKEAAVLAGAREVFLVQDPYSAAVGMGLDIGSSKGQMVVDIGGGVVEASLLALGGIVLSRSLRVAGESLDRAITEDIRKRRGVLVGNRESEKIKNSIGTIQEESEQSMEVCGRSLIQSAPATISYNSKEAKGAITQTLDKIVQEVKMAIQKTPPDFASDILDGGIHLTGGVALLKGIGSFFEKELKLPVHVSPTPLVDIARGAGEILCRPGARLEHLRA